MQRDSAGTEAKNQTLNNYSFTDEAPNDGVNYYRSLSVDKDGRISFSEVRNIEYRTRDNELRVYPNPAKDFVTVECKNAKEILIIDCLGRVVYKEIASSLAMTNRITINTKQFAKGVYVVKAIATNGAVEITKYTKE